MEEQTIVIDLDIPMDFVTNGITRAYTAVCFALNLNNSSEVNLYPYQQHTPGEPPIQMLPDKMTSEELAGYKEVFLQWVIGNAIRELTECFGIFLDKIYYYVSSVSQAKIIDGKTAITNEMIEAHWKQNADFEAKGISQKLETLKRYGITTELMQHIETLNIARNCLTHRAGIVGEGVLGDRDLNDKNKENMVLKWNYVKLCIVHPTGEIEDWVDNETNKKYPEGVNLTIAPTIKTKIIKKGMRLKLHPNEIGQICFNFKQATFEVHKSTIAYLNSLGITVETVTA